MVKLSLEEIVRKIELGLTFEATPQDDSFRIKIEDYIPFVCAAIHNGHNFQGDLEANCLLDDYERWYEEDPQTASFIRSFPIVIVGNDSRYEYDLNRAPSEAIYDVAWGRKVWDKPISEEQKTRGLEKHNGFYMVVNALIAKIEQLFGACIVFDIHSYNYKRYNRYLPLFNLGTDKIDQKRFKPIIKYWFKELDKVALPDIVNTVAINDIFYGHGYFLSYITGNFKNTLVLATEIKKVYCNEETGENYPLVISLLTQGLKRAILNTSTYYSRKHTRLTVRRKERLLSSELDKDILQVDKQLFNLVKNFEILNYVNPINLEVEKKRFYKSKFFVNPKFRYKQLVIDPFDFKRKLYQMPIEKIKDINLQILFKDVINSYADKVDLLTSIGKTTFVYNSLRYFGEPSERDIGNANFLLHCPDVDDEYEEMFNVTEVKELFEKTIAEYGFEAKVEIAKNVVSKVLVLNSKKLIRLRADATFSRKNMHALANHEVGVHMVTTINSRNQPLNLLRIGLPVNTLTQEGLAILSEYLSDNLSVFRLKQLALRVLTVKNMLNGMEFRQAFEYLMDTKILSEDEAFYMVTRVFRGGGFTKDYLYLKGFRYLLNYYMEGHPLDNLLIGKTSLGNIATLNELVERKLLLPPKYKTQAFIQPVNINPIMKYLITSIR